MFRDLYDTITDSKLPNLLQNVFFSNGRVYTIFHEHLGMSKVSAKWVPRNLNMQDRQ